MQRVILEVGPVSVQGTYHSEAVMYGPSAQRMFSCGFAMAPFCLVFITATFEGNPSMGHSLIRVRNMG